MRFKREEREWLFVQESDHWDIFESDNGILLALRLSFSHLASHLKGCFAYCSIFPRNYIFKKEKLIQLWIVEGLIQSPERRRSLEFIGNEYFDDLVWTSFFQFIQRDDHGNLIEYKMHNLTHDLAQSVSGSEYLKLEDNSIVRVADSLDAKLDAHGAIVEVGLDLPFPVTEVGCGLTESKISRLVCEDSLSSDKGEVDSVDITPLALWDPNYVSDLVTLEDDSDGSSMEEELEPSEWVRMMIKGFGIGFPIACCERQCIVFFQKLERV
ncbi:hypothetical protein SO802_032638 [Lithocarpus litseifolius]|uniref:Disease resistance protein winged helix domain-containing protein n=1 Tax=Lithocarpus litseifolius TaxID=425828 RepID=A0AAW2BCC4_9ROSI